MIEEFNKQEVVKEIIVIQKIPPLIKKIIFLLMNKKISSIIINILLKMNYKDYNLYRSYMSKVSSRIQHKIEIINILNKFK